MTDLHEIFNKCHAVISGVRFGMKLEPEEFQISVLYGHDFAVTL